jgi:hypothetical protein
MQPTANQKVNWAHICDCDGSMLDCNEYSGSWSVVGRKDTASTEKMLSRAWIGSDSIAASCVG